MASFLDLPLELRDLTYAYLAIPDCAPFSTYLGLYLSCHQIKFEMDSECGYIFHEHLRSLRSPMTTADFKIPTTLMAQQHIRLEMNLAFSVWDQSDQFLPLLNLHLATLTIVISPGDWFEDRTTRILCWIMILVIREGIHVRRIVVDMPASDKEHADVWWNVTSVIPTTVPTLTMGNITVPVGKYKVRWVFIRGRSVNSVKAVWELPGVSAHGSTLDSQEKLVKVVQCLAQKDSIDMGLPPGTY